MQTPPDARWTGRVVRQEDLTALRRVRQLPGVVSCGALVLLRSASNELSHVDPDEPPSIEQIAADEARYVLTVESYSNAIFLLLTLT